MIGIESNCELARTQENRHDEIKPFKRNQVKGKWAIEIGEGKRKKLRQGGKQLLSE